MDPLKPHKPHFTQGPLHRTPPKMVSKKTEVEQSDTFKPSEQEAVKAKPKKPSLGRRMLKWGFAAFGIASTLSGIVGGIGVATNHEVITEALAQEQPIKIFGQDLEYPESTSTGGTTATKEKSVATNPLDLSQLSDDVQLSKDGRTLTARIDAADAQGAINQVRATDLIQGSVVSELETAEAKITESLGRLEIPPGETLLSARVPFPSGDGSILQVAGKSLPVGIRKLAMEELPLVLNYEIDPIETGLDVDLTRTKVETATPPAGADKSLHIGSVRAEVSHPESGRMNISGRVRVELDDGTATRRALENTTDPVRREALQKRLAQIERISELSKDQNIEGVVDLVAGARELSFSGQLQGNSQKIGDGIVHAWLTPDKDNDQRGDVALTGELYTAALDSLQFEADSLTVKGKEGFLNEKVSGLAENAVTGALPQVMGALKDTVNSKVQARFQRELGNVGEHIDARFDETLDAASQSGITIRQLDIDSESGDLLAEVTTSQSIIPQVRIRTEKAPKTQTQSTSEGPDMVAVTTRSSVGVQRNKPAVIIPGSSARQFLNELIQKPEIQQTFQDLTGPAREEVEEAVSELEGPKGSVGLDVDVLFPSAEYVQSPVGAIPKLTKKTVPFTADYQVDDFGLDLSLDMQPVEVEQAVRPEAAKEHGVFIGAVRVKTKPMTSDISGSVQLHKHETKGGAEWAEKAMDEAFKDQNFGFDSEVSVGETENLFYVWAVPDQTGDGRADVAVAYSTVNSGVDSLQIKMKKVERESEAPQDQSETGQKLNAVVARVLQEQMKNSGERLADSVSGVLEQRISEVLAKGSTDAAGELNEYLAKFYSKIGDLEIPVPEGMEVPGGKLSLQLGQVRVQGDNIISEYGNERTDELMSQVKPSSLGPDFKEVAPGELQAHVPGAVFNRLLADKSVDGPLDWNAMFKNAVKDSSAVKSLELAKDDQGRTISPTLRVVDGKPTLTIQVDGETNGIATPVSAGARLLPGFVGDGLGWISDNTVGAVLGSRLQTEIQVPLDFNTEDGQLKVNTGDVKFATPEKTDFNIVDILPTRLLSSLITDGVASAFGPSSVNDALAKGDIKADLSEFGLQWERVEASGREGEVPDLRVGVRLGRNLPNMISNHVKDKAQ